MWKKVSVMVVVLVLGVAASVYCVWNSAELRIRRAFEKAVASTLKQAPESPLQAAAKALDFSTTCALVIQVDNDAGLPEFLRREEVRALHLQHRQAAEQIEISVVRQQITADAARTSAVMRVKAVLGLKRPGEARQEIRDATLLWQKQLGEWVVVKAVIEEPRSFAP